MSFPGSWEPAIAAFKRLFGALSAESVAANAADVYAEGVHFDDTLKVVEGREAVVAYLSDSAAAIDTCTVEFDDVAAADDGVYVRWRMTMVARRLAGGEPIASHGITWLRFDHAGKVIAHRDYWDSGSGLYAHVPVVGWAVRKIRAKL